LRPIRDIFRRLPPGVIFALALLVVAIVGYVDWRTGAVAALGPFYVIGIGLVAWYVHNGRAVAAIVIVAGALRLFAGLTASSASDSFTLALVNGWSGPIFFAAVGWALAALRAARYRQNELVNFVVHDLRSPLAVSTTALGLLDDYATGLVDSDRSLVRDALAANKRLQTLIDAILDTARLESGRLPLNIDVMDPCGAAEEAVAQVDLWAAQRQVSLSLDADGPLPWALADPDLTTRVLVNLLHNAVKYSPVESRVSVVISAEPAEPPHLRFTVTDQGPGIAPEWADRIFEKFIQVEAQRAGRPVGAGLGLTFCRLAVEVMGGRIWLAHSGAEGTTICFTLPAAPSAVPQRLHDI
jgi:signal transduction histidine kinase